MINTVGVIGLGTMGAGIVEVFAKAGLSVVAVDGSAELAERGRGFLTASLERAVAKGKLDASARDATLARVSFGADLSALADVDLVIEAVPERLEIKTAIFTQLDNIVREDCVLATNTSSLSITEIAKTTAHPARVIGMHFFNPAPVLPLVEVIHSLLTDPALVDEVRELAVRLGKQPVVVGDHAGFVANALLIAYLARAIRHYENGLASREDLDAAMAAGVGFPMGPLTLCDLIGLDVVKEVCEVLFDATRDPSVAAPSLLRQMVTAGRLGRKTGQGFYTYAQAGSGKVVDDANTPVALAPLSGRVGVVGAGELVDEIAEEIGAAGLTVVRVRTADEASALAGVSFVLAIDGGDDDCGADCCGGACAADSDVAPSGVQIEDKPVLRAVRDAMGETGVIATLGEGAAASATMGDPVVDAFVVPVVLHEEQRAGQVLEIGRSIAVADHAVEATRAFAVAAGWVPVVGKDRAGLVVDALLYPHLNDAVKMLDSGYASVEDIDTAMKAGCGYPQGPFELLDESGLPDVAGVLSEMYFETGGEYLLPSPLIGEYAMAQRTFRG